MKRWVPIAAILLAAGCGGGSQPKYTAAKVMDALDASGMKYELKLGGQSTSADKTPPDDAYTCDDVDPEVEGIVSIEICGKAYAPGTQLCDCEKPPPPVRSTWYENYEGHWIAIKRYGSNVYVLSFGEAKQDGTTFSDDYFQTTRALERAGFKTNLTVDP